MNEKFRLVAAHFLRIIRITTEVAGLKKRPVYLAEGGGTGEVLSGLKVGMSICE